MAKFCGKCGAQLDDNAVFCNACGAQLGATGGNAGMPSFVTNYAKNLSTRNHWLLTFAAQFICLIFSTLALISVGSGSSSSNLSIWDGLSGFELTGGSVFYVIFLLAYIAAVVYMFLPIAFEKAFTLKSLLPVAVVAAAYFVYNIIMVLCVTGEFPSYAEAGLSVWGIFYIIISIAVIADLVLFTLKCKSENM